MLTVFVCLQTVFVLFVDCVLFPMEAMFVVVVDPMELTFSCRFSSLSTSRNNPNATVVQAPPAQASNRPSSFVESPPEIAEQSKALARFIASCDNCIGTHTVTKLMKKMLTIRPSP